MKILVPLFRFSKTRAHTHPSVFSSLRRRLIVWFTVALVISLGRPTISNAAVCSDSACVQVSGRLASVNTQNSVLLNALLGQLLGTSVNLTVVNWQSLANANVNLLDVLQILQGQASLSTPQAALTTSFTLSQILTATASALQTRGNTAAATAITTLAVGSPTAMMKLSDLLNLCVQCTSFADVNINALDLISGMASIYNYQNMITTPSPISLTGTALGQGAITSINLYAQVLEPPVIVCGPTGTQFFGASIRLKLDVNLLTVDLSAILAALNINLPTGAANLKAQLTHLSIFATVARAQGTLQTINAMGSAVNVQAIPGVVALYIGTMSDSVFFNRNHTINAATDLTPGVIGALQVTLLGINLSLDVLGQAAGVGDAPINSNLVFTGAFPQTQTVSTSSFFISDLVSSTLATLQLSVNITSPTSLTTLVQNLLNAVLSLITGALNLVFSGAISPILSPILTGVVDPLLSLLGIQLGQADVTVLGAHRYCTYTVSGVVYKDANRNGFIDGTEAGTGLTLYAKLVSSTAPTGPALQSAVVNTTTGAYSFSTVGSGTYNIVIDDNATLTDITQTTPPIGWTGGEQGTLVRTSLVNIADLPNQNFGLIAATLLSGSVFVDDGHLAGTANDGSLNGGELGLNGTTVTLLTSTGTVLDTAVTPATGQYKLYIPSTVAVGTALKVVQTRLSGEIATGANVGNTAGTFTRATDTTAFTFASIAAYTGVNFGDVSPVQLLTDGQQNASASTIVYFTHKFIASTAGQVTFNITVTPSSTSDNWSQALYLDTNGNGQIDAGELPITGPISVTSGQSLALILKVAVPSTATAGARAKASVQASLALSNASPALTLTQTRTDLTIVGNAADSGLVLVKNVDKTTAKPGDVLTYTIAYSNKGTGPFQQFIIYDATPAFTHFVTTTTGTLPTGLTAAAVAAPAGGGTGAIKWTFTGVLNPSASGNVTFSVSVDQ